VTLGALILGRYMKLYTFHVQHNTSWCFKCKIHFLASSVRKMYIHVHTGIYCHVRIQTKVTTTFHFESGLIRLATPTSYQSTLEPFIACSMLPLPVSATVRPPRLGLPRPNCHSQGLTSLTLLPRLPSDAAALAQPNGMQESLRSLNL
jgi:hypothetical protein